jgi:hypothetical protein
MYSVRSKEASLANLNQLFPKSSNALPISLLPNSHFSTQGSKVETKKILLIVTILAITAVGSVAGLAFSGIIAIAPGNSNAERVTLASWTTPNATVRNSGASSVTLARYDISVGQITSSEVYFNPSVTLTVGAVYTFSIADICANGNNCLNNNVTIHVTTQTGHLFSFSGIYTLPQTQEKLNIDSSAFANSTSLVLYVRNTGTVTLTLTTYYVKDSNGDQYAMLSWSGPTINPNGVVAATITIGSNCSGCTLSGSAFTFTAGYSYTVTLVTTRNNQFVNSFTR